MTPDELLQDHDRKWLILCPWSVARNLRRLTGMRNGVPRGSAVLQRPVGLRGPGGGVMGMDTWYDLRIQQLFDLTGRVNELLVEVKDTGEDVAPTPAPRVRELFDLTDRVSDLLKEVQGDK